METVKVLSFKLPDEVDREDISNTDKKKRVATAFDSWLFTSDDLDPKNQFGLVKIVADQEISNVRYPIIRHFLRQKCSGYRSQDLRKGKYCMESFMILEHIINLLLDGMKCFYCREDVMIVYENVRDPRQWTLERIDNSLGHNRDNCVIACLKCNLKRRTMYHERYVMTKQMRVIKVD